MAYLVANGHGVALVSLAAFVPQPRTDATVRPVQRNDSASGVIHEIGAYITLEWNVMTVAQYQALIAQVGLSATTTTNSVTIYVPNQTYVPTRYNATVRLPEQGVGVRRNNYFLHDIALLFTKLVSL